MGLSFSHLLVVILVVVLLFGRGRISSVMSEIAKGMRSFRDEMKGDDEKDKSENP